MEDFFYNMQLNNWLSTIFYVIGAFAFFYIVFYFFSKEGRKSKGKIILAKSGMVAFSSAAIMTGFMLLISNYLIFNIYTAGFAMIALHAGYCGSQALAIIFLKRRYKKV